MGLVNGSWLIVLGILGAASLIVARRPDARQAIAKLAPYQGWIGAVSALWGAWGIISAIMNIGWLSLAPVLWITYLADAVLQLGLGILLGIGVMKTFVKDASAHARADRLMTRLAPYQGTMGIAAIAVGAWMVVAGFIFRLA